MKKYAMRLLATDRHARMRWRWVFSIGLLFCCSAAASRVTEEETVVVTDTQAVQGGVAKLPCDIVPPIANDTVHLVIWYKDGLNSPIYSFDARGKKSLEQGKHWTDAQALGGRAKFQPRESPAKLAVENARDADAGVYRCRVDFRKSPTRNSKVNLDIIIPPEKLVIMEERGSNIPHYILGPYNEGSSVNITCIATGGRPPPRVTWWQDNALLDDQWEALPGRRVRNTLHLRKLARHQLHAVLTCQAASSPLAAPLSGAVTLDLNLRPLWVQLTSQRRPLSADNTYEISCEVVGTRPPPVVTWWKGGVPLRNTREMTSPDGNTTTSTLTFVPSMEDSGKLLTCRASTPLIPDSTLEDSWKLDIYHVPIVTLELGSNLNATNIKEGSDVYFECNIKSNPWVYRISWRHNGQPLYNNATAGTIVSNQSLVLQAVTRERDGFYTCVGSNQEGDGESNPVHLDVKFRPVCASGQTQMYGVARQETARVSCEVESNPGDGLSFSWRFNNSADSTDIAAALVVVDRSRSVALYTPHTEFDYGTLLCWAKNDVGEQKAPCVFTLFPAGRPDPPHNCSIVNQTADSLHVECSEGFDGGLPQEFVMEVYDAASQALVGNVSSRAPAFTVSGLQPGLGFDVALLAANSKGRSRAVTLHAYTLQPAERRAAATTHVLEITPILGILIGVVSALVLVAVVIVIVMRVRGRSGAEGEKSQSVTSGGDNDDDDEDFGLKSRNGEIKAVKATSGTAVARDGGVGNGDGGVVNGGGTQKDAEGSAEGKDERDPDIIPQSSDKESNEDQNKALGNMREIQRQIYDNKIPNRMYSPQFRNLANLPANRVVGEVTYAELALCGAGATLPRPVERMARPEPTVYAQLDVVRQQLLQQHQQHQQHPQHQQLQQHQALAQARRSPAVQLRDLCLQQPPTPSLFLHPASPLRQDDEQFVSAATPLIAQQHAHPDSKVMLQSVSDKARGSAIKTPRVTATRF
ncbi:nephrin-like [Schistocerca americana]|uniref:nephrin-like n=1 Tax=Schistocerca americana TaxID=7009 RepID=UPI001F4F1706|nr:nephrin-like [Schistocerca americana]XP_049960790.1 nephrin-like isoform X1 [Schistocerca serialis cubense]